MLRSSNPENAKSKSPSDRFRALDTAIRGSNPRVDVSRGFSHLTGVSETLEGVDIDLIRAVKALY